MKKKGFWFLFAGIVLMSLPVFTRSFIVMTEDVGDFLKGFGLALMIGALFQKDLRERISIFSSSRDDGNMSKD
jgi:hypothetical protein